MNNISLYRDLYRTLSAEAVNSFLVASAAEFTLLALAGVPDTVKAQARGGDVNAICELCDAAEAWLDAASVLDGDEACEVAAEFRVAVMD